MQLYYVNTLNDWEPVRTALWRNAIHKPVLKDGRYSTSEKEAFEVAKRIVQRGPDAIAEVTKYSALVVYHHRTVISLVLTDGPKQGPHLSMTSIIADNEMERLGDTIALEAATEILGTVVERTEGAVSAIRHFFL